MDYQDQKINLVLNKVTKEQYDKLVLSSLIDDQQLYLVEGDGPVQGDARYNLIRLNPSLSTVTIAGVQMQALTCQAQDLAINTISTDTSAYSIVVYMPPMPTDSGARDFCVRVECLSSAPSIAFVGSNSESCDFESTDDEWAKLETGVNLFNFTETKR